MAEGRVCKEWNGIPLALFDFNLKGAFRLPCAVGGAQLSAQGYTKGVYRSFSSLHGTTSNSRHSSILCLACLNTKLTWAVLDCGYLRSFFLIYRESSFCVYFVLFSRFMLLGALGSQCKCSKVLVEIRFLYSRLYTKLLNFFGFVPCIKLLEVNWYVLHVLQRNSFLLFNI